MTRCDISTFDLLARERAVLRSVGDRFPDALLIGSYARDLHAHGVARLPRGRSTQDFDFTIEAAVPEDYRTRVRDLRTLTGTGLCFEIEGFQVDLIPYGGEDVIIEPAPGVTLDVTGMAEAAVNSVRFDLGDDLVIRCPDLSSLLVLKLIAWDYRGAVNPKDAADIDLLLRAGSSGGYEDAVWSDEQAGAAMGWIPERVGAYRLGRTALPRFDPVVIDRLQRIVTGAGAAELIRNADVDRMTPRAPRAEVLAEMLEAFAAGLADTEAP